MSAFLKMYQTNVLWPLMLARADVERLNTIQDLRRIAYCIISYPRKVRLAAHAQLILYAIECLRYDTTRGCSTLH